MNFPWKMIEGIHDGILEQPFKRHLIIHDDRNGICFMIGWLQ